MSFHRRATRCLAGLTALALAAPAARAQGDHFPPGINEQEQEVLASRGLAAATPPLKANLGAPNLRAANDAFDWGFAGVGAGAIGGLIVLAAGLGLTRRARVNPKPRLS